jgi:hypothetical protein
MRAAPPASPRSCATGRRYREMECDGELAQLARRRDDRRRESSGACHAPSKRRQLIDDNAGVTSNCRQLALFVDPALPPGLRNPGSCGRVGDSLDLTRMASRPEPEPCVTLSRPPFLAIQQRVSAHRTARGWCIRPNGPRADAVALSDRFARCFSIAQNSIISMRRQTRRIFEDFLGNNLKLL